MAEKANDPEIFTRLSSLETGRAVLESQCVFLGERLTRHKEEFNLRIDRILDVIERHEKILFQDGLVSTVKTNSDYIKSQMSSRANIINAIYKSVITLGVAYIAMKVGLK